MADSRIRIERSGPRLCSSSPADGQAGRVETQGAERASLGRKSVREGLGRSSLPSLRDRETGKTRLAKPDLRRFLSPRFALVLSACSQRLFVRRCLWLSVSAHECTRAKCETSR